MVKFVLKLRGDIRQGLNRAYDWIFSLHFTRTKKKKHMIGGSGTQAVLVGAWNPLRLTACPQQPKETA
jgi:hypothetical protein